MRNRRWRIIGTLTTTSPLHIGSGEVINIDHLSLKADDQSLNDIQAIVRDHQKLPCIPGTAIKGVLRAWAESKFPSNQAEVKRIFGNGDFSDSAAESGWAEFCTATIQMLDTTQEQKFAAHVPYWAVQSDNHKMTGIASHVCIDRFTGTAAHNKLFFEEFVPEGLTFNVEINCSRLDKNEIAFLLAILKTGTSHPTHPLQFGANGSDGWGRMKWDLQNVSKCENPTIANDKVGFDCCTEEAPVTPLTIPPSVPSHISMTLNFVSQGPFLVNDGSRGKPKNCSDKEKRNYTDFSPLRRADGTVWLPASSLRGVLRERAEFLLRSLNPNASGDPGKSVDIQNLGPIERLFGYTGQAARLVIEEPKEVGNCSVANRQDFVAIDRFTGGAADGAKFDATYADQPKFDTQLTLNTQGLTIEDIALFHVVLEELCTGRTSIGWGGAKGYGAITGELKALATHRLDATWTITKETFQNFSSSTEPGSLRRHLSILLTTVEAQRTSIPQRNIPQKKLLSGTLLVLKTKKGLDYKLNFSGDKSVKVYEDDVHESLRKESESGVPVEYEMEDRKRVRILPAGTERESQPSIRVSSPADNEFAHPYYFSKLTDRPSTNSLLKDEKPTGHAHWQRGTFSGKLSIRLKSKTPLLIPAPLSEAERSKPHKTYDLLRDKKNLPILPTSSVRGTLRSAYELITNSRFGVFPGREANDNIPAEKHGRRLGLRLPAQIKSIPCRVIQDTASPSKLSIELLPGSEPDNGVLALESAWLGMYAGNQPDNPSNIEIAHGIEVWAFLTPWKYSRNTIRGNTIAFNFWNVEEIQPNGSNKPTNIPTRKRCSSRNATQDNWANPDWFKGYICITQRNMQGKHDERFFFSESKPDSFHLNVKHLQQWRQLIEDYHDQHSRELEMGLTAPPPLSRPNTFSRHVSTNPPSLNLSDLDLKAGDLCYAEIENQNGEVSIKALYPVTISRKLFESSPLERLPRSLHPAKSIDQLSPADRLFGWVNQESDTAEGEQQAAYRSHVRVGPVTCVTAAADAVDTFKPKTLAILGQPKPQQGRFYLGQADGSAQPSGKSKEAAGYKEPNRIRGPKVYPHHKHAENYQSHSQWERDNPQAFASTAGNQNRSITGWVKPGAEFTFDLHLTNVSAVELGALIWLLTLPEANYLRMGLGKPLGFGSVRVEIDLAQSTIADGIDWIKKIVDPSHQFTAVDFENLKAEFEAAIKGVNPDLLKSFLIATQGFDGPIHYPMRTSQAAGDTKHYEWFVENETAGQQSLPDLTSLNPYLKTN